MHFINLGIEQFGNLTSGQMWNFIILHLGSLAIGEFANLVIVQFGTLAFVQFGNWEFGTLDHLEVGHSAFGQFCISFGYPIWLFLLEVLDILAFCPLGFCAI